MFFNKFNTRKMMVGIYILDKVYGKDIMPSVLKFTDTLS